MRTSPKDSTSGSPVGLGAASLQEGIRAAGLNSARARRQLEMLGKGRRELARCARASENVAKLEQSFAKSWRQAAGLASAVIRSWQIAEARRAELAAKLVERLQAHAQIDSAQAAFRSIPQAMSLQEANDRWFEVSSAMRRALGLKLPERDDYNEEEIDDAVDVLDLLFIDTVRMAAFRRVRPSKIGAPLVSAAVQDARKRASLRRLIATPEHRREKVLPTLIRRLHDPVNPNGDHELADLEEQIAFLRVGLDLAKRLDLPAAPSARPEKAPPARPEKKSKRGRSTPATSAPESLEAFAARVRATHHALRKRDIRSDGSRDRQFISDLFGATEWGLDLAAFKRRLLDARRAALVTLTRGDLIAALPAEKVRASLVEQGDRQFHYVEIVE